MPQLGRLLSVLAWTHLRGRVAGVVVFLVLAAVQMPARASGPREPVVVGIQVSVGGRYDNVRLCVASGAGVKGGPSADISFFTGIGIGNGRSLLINIPVMRPILFAAAFNMLQFEPDVTLAFRVPGGSSPDVIAGPSLGFTLHYGPDFHSEPSGPGRGQSFFALGPRFGGYVGFDFKRPGELFNFQLALHPYLAPLWGVGDPDHHQGLVVGGNLEGQLRFDTSAK